MSFLFFTFDGSEVSNRMNLDVFTKILSKAAKKNPKSSVSDLPWVAAINWVAGPGHVEITSNDGELKNKVIGTSGKDVIYVNDLDTVVLMPKEGEAWTLAFSGSEMTKTKGVSSRPLTSADPIPSDTPDQILVRKWLLTGKTGVSSKTISHVLFGIPESLSPEDYDAPYDFSDLGRCVAFMEMVPSARERIGELSSVYGWEKIALNWPELEKMYKEANKNLSKESDKLYSRMRDLRDRPLRSSP